MLSDRDRKHVEKLLVSHTMEHNADLNHCLNWAKTLKKHDDWPQKVPSVRFEYGAYTSFPVIYPIWCWHYNLDLTKWMYGPPSVISDSGIEYWTFKLTNTCNNERCVNPTHFKCEKVPLTAFPHHPLTYPYGEEFFN